MRARLRTVFLAALLVVFALSSTIVPSQQAAAHSIRINNALPANGDVVKYRISPDSTYLVYLADQEIDEKYELYRVNLTGNNRTPFKINPTLVYGGNVYDFEISPDSSFVVYIADQRIEDVYELFTTISGPDCSNILSGNDSNNIGNPTKKTPLPEYVDVWDFKISPDSSHVAFIASYGENGNVKPSTALATPKGDKKAAPKTAPAAPKHSEGHWHAYNLYSADVEGCTLQQKNGTLSQNGEIWNYEIDANSAHIIYIADISGQNIWELFSAPLTNTSVNNSIKVNNSGESIKLHEDLQTNEEVTHFKIAPDGSRVIFHGDIQQADVFHLYSVPLTSSNYITLTAGNDSDWSYWHFDISPDSSKVVYMIFDDSNTTAPSPKFFFDPAIALAVNSLYGELQVILSGDISFEKYIGDFKIAPNSLSVAYTMNNNGYIAFDLYVTPFNLPPVIRTKLNPDLGEYSLVHLFEYSPDSQRIVFTIVSCEVGSIPFTVPAAGGTAELLAPLQMNMQARQLIDTIKIDPDSKRVLLLTLPEAMTDDILINKNPKIKKDPNGGCDDLLFFLYLLYFGYDIDNFNALLYSVSLTGGTMGRISQPVRDGYTVLRDFQFLPGTLEVIYRADHIEDDTFELLSGTLGRILPVVLHKPNSGW